MLATLVLLAALLGTLALPAAAAADSTTYTYRVPISVDPYQVKQQVAIVPHPAVDGFITHMQADIVDGNGDPVPIQRLMLHHVVFINVNQPDSTCDSILGFDNKETVPGRERFFAAGEERARMMLPQGYGYKQKGSDTWAMLYMVMNHSPVPDNAYIQYQVTVDTDTSITPVTPYWMDVRNCRADPIYNVRGTGGSGSTDVETMDFNMPESGRIVAGGGHVHGGAERLTLTEPDCGDQKLAKSVPTWGMPDHPFYTVSPVLHEPGPINMSAFNTPTGIPVSAGEHLRLSSRYDDSQPHTRVMGIMILYVAHDAGVTQSCEPPPDDVTILKTDQPGRTGPIIPFEVPINGLDETGTAVPIDAPPGDLQQVRPGSTIKVGDRFFSKPNVKIPRGSRLHWDFASQELHNVTLANGPEAIGSPNLNGDRVFTKRFEKAGTYRLFCALHPVQMTERVVVSRSTGGG